MKKINLITKLVCTLFVFCAMCFWVAPSFAAGTMQLKGKLQSFSKEMIVVVDEWNYYEIDRKGLTPDQEKQVRAKKVNDEVSLAVPFTIIKSVRPAPAPVPHK